MTVRELAAALATLPVDQLDMVVRALPTESDYVIEEVYEENGVVLLDGKGRSW